MAKPRHAPPAPPPSNPVETPSATGAYYNRWLVYGLLTVLGGLMLPEAIPQYTLLHGRVREWFDPVLDFTGLWQGEWELFAPSPDHVNLRIGATIGWQGFESTEWMQPDWHNMSSWDRTRYFRQMSYYDNLARTENDQALVAFCRHLAREQSAQTDKRLTSITLFLQRDVIAPPDERWRVAYSAPQFAERQTLKVWVPNVR
jgi:hypothetical protein